ncbi:MAG: acyl-CoA dehydrogenase family protein [Acidobacteriota bacterium]
MDFGLSEPQRMLQQTTAQFLTETAPLERVRQIMDSKEGYDAELLTQLGDQGLLGLLVDEEHGGFGLGLLDTIVAAQTLGAHSTPVNFHDQAVFAPLLLASIGGPLAEEWLPKVASGAARVSVADGALEATDAGLRALYVPDALHADAFLVVRGDEVFFVASENAVTEPLETVDDTRRLGDATFGNLGSPLEISTQQVQRARQAAQIALAADALGASRQGLDIAVDYAMQREQFGRIIGSYQGLKHVCAEVVAELDPVQSLVWFAAFSWDEQSPDVPWLAPLTKAHATEVGSYAVTQTTQVFGGIGFTWECDMHLFYKRVGFDRQLLGNPAELRRLAADLQHPAGGS